ncbi:MAG: tetratricopeptide repeat protein [Nitrosopumilus sp.]|nr:tetratricopeptide repeat protein [Nitrosopumilus sp.]
MSLSKIFLDQLEELVNSGDYEKAIILIDSKLNLESDIESKSSLWALKGKTLSMQAYGTKTEEIRITVGDPPKVSYNYQLIQQAITCFDKSIELKPDNMFAYENKGLSLARKGDFKDAIKCAIAALDINPENTTVLVNLSKWYKDISLFNESISYADKAIQCGNMASKEVLIAAYTNKGIAQFNLGQQDYEKSLESAIEITSNPEMKKDIEQILEDAKREFILR